MSWNGLVASYGRPGARRHTRLTFAQPVADHAELAGLLHPMLCRRAATRPAPDGG